MDGRDFTGAEVDGYLLTSLLGSGGSGSVYIAINTSLLDSYPFAIKCVRESTVHARRRQQFAEIKNHRAVAKCPNVLTLHEALIGEGYLFLVSPLLASDMFRAIWTENAYWMNESRIKKVFVDLLDGVLACHNKGVYHRDLKPENILCTTDGMHVRIGDFGLSTDRGLCNDGGCGTAPYMSPECWDEYGTFYYAAPVDIWSLGVILFNMVTCLYPWNEARETDQEYMNFCTEKGYLLRKYPISESLNTLLRQIWHPAPLLRLSIPAIRHAILGMDTFYEPYPQIDAVLPLSTEPGAVDSQQTCIEVLGDAKTKNYRASI